MRELAPKLLIPSFAQLKVEKKHQDPSITGLLLLLLIIIACLPTFFFKFSCVTNFFLGCQNMSLKYIYI